MIYDRLPPKPRKLVSIAATPLNSFLLRIHAIVSGVRQPFYLLEGNEKRSGEGLTAFISGKEISLAYLSNLIYSGEPSKVDLGKSFIWRAKSKARALQPNPDLTFVEVDRFYASIFKRLEFTLIPKWVLFNLDISKPLPEIMETIKNKSLDNNLRKMRKHNFTCEITRDPDKFDIFYHQMYLPYAAMRFGKASWIFSFRYLKRLLGNGQLLLVKLKNEYLVGALLLDREKRLFSHSLGVKNGNVEHIRQGAVTASYYFTIQLAKNKGYESIDFGLCRPLLRDGVFVYKKRWGMAIKNVKRSESQGVFCLKVSHFTKSVRCFLTENPFIFIDRGKLKGLVVADQAQPLSSKDVQKLMRIHYMNGLDSIIIVCPHGYTQEARETAKARYPRLLKLADVDLAVFFERLPTPKKDNLRIERSAINKEDTK